MAALQSPPRLDTVTKRRQARAFAVVLKMKFVHRPSGHPSLIQRRTSIWRSFSGSRSAMPSVHQIATKRAAPPRQGSTEARLVQVRPCCGASLTVRPIAANARHLPIVTTSPKGPASRQRPASGDDDILDVASGSVAWCEEPLSKPVDHIRPNAHADYIAETQMTALPADFSGALAHTPSEKTSLGGESTCVVPYAFNKLRFESAHV